MIETSRTSATASARETTRPPLPTPPRRWRRLPARTIRLRLTVLYGSLFLACGAGLLTITYLLVKHHYSGNFFVSVQAHGSAPADPRRRRASKPGSVISGNRWWPCPGRARGRRAHDRR